MTVPASWIERMARRPDAEALLRRRDAARALADGLEDGAGSAEGEALDALAGGAPLLVAGQQAGLLLGPAYSLHKALALVAAQRRLEERTGEPVCALFWIEANDHDWIEAARVDSPGAPEWKPAPPDGAEGRSTGRIELPAAWTESALAALAPRLADDPAGEAPRWLDVRPGDTLATAFARRLRSLFAGTGLLAWNPSTPAARALAAPFFSALHRLGAGFGEELAARADRLRAEGRPAPVAIDGRAPWFEEDRDGRRRRADWTAPLAEPDRLSPNVLTRPLLQDWLLAPAVALLGPGELAYHAQIDGLEALAGATPALRAPRPTLQWTRDEDRRALLAAGLDPWNPPQPGSPWPEEFLAALPGGDAVAADAARLDAACAAIDAVAAEWDERAGRRDLAPLAERARAATAQLGDRIRAAHRGVHKPLLRELHESGRWQDGPAGPQERRISSAALWLRLGGDRLLESALDAIDPFERRQQRLTVEPREGRVTGKDGFA